MWLLIVEALIALGLFVFIVWWTMSSRRKTPVEADEPEQTRAAPVPATMPAPAGAPIAAPIAAPITAPTTASITQTAPGKNGDPAEKQPSAKPPQKGG